MEQTSVSSYSSRKFILTVISLLLVTVVSLAVVKYPAVSTILPTFIGGILGVLSMYMAGNITNKYVTGKTTNNIGGDETNGVDVSGGD